LGINELAAVIGERLAHLVGEQARPVDARGIGPGAHAAIERGARGALGHDAGGKVQLDHQIEARAHRRRAGQGGHDLAGGRHRNGPAAAIRPVITAQHRQAHGEGMGDRRIGLDQFEAFVDGAQGLAHHGHAALAALGGDGPGGDRALALLVQSVSQVSTESVQASQGSAGSGQVCGFHKSAIGRSTADSRWPSRASPVSSGVALGGSRLSTRCQSTWPAIRTATPRHAPTCWRVIGTSAGAG
jgi:hypothetical protein